MRSKQKIKKTRREKWIWRGKKLALFLIVFLFLVGLAAVDGSYADMMHKDGSLTLQVKRVDENCISLSLFGQTREVNLLELEQRWNSWLIEAQQEFRRIVFDEVVV